MRFVIYGAGAVGGSIALRLASRGVEVAVIARGAHAAAVRDRGFVLEKPDGTHTARPHTVVEHPRDLAWTGDEVVLLAMMSQHTADALDALAGCAPPSIEVVCAQNGIENERMALRRFPRVAAMYVWMPGEHVAPGVARIYTAPHDGIVDVGRYPRGTDDRIAAIAAAFDGTPFDAVVRPDIMAWKHFKLVWNLHNGVDAACGELASDAAKELLRRAHAEGVAAMAAAGLEMIAVEAEAARRGDRFPFLAVGGARRAGGSTHRSLVRGSGSVEVDYLNGEIALLGRLHGVPTPVNELLQRTVNDLSRRGLAPGTVTAAALLARLG